MFTTELQYAVVRYMLNDLADEAANVGIVLVTEDPPRILYRFLEDPTVKSRSDARVRGDAVDRFASYAESQIQRFLGDTGGHFVSAADVFARLTEFGGNLVRLSMPRSVLTNDVERDFEALFSQIVAPLPSPSARKAYARRDPLRGLRLEASRALVKAFREGYGHRLSRKTFARSYEVRGVSHKNIIDLALLSGTRKKPREHLFHHLLLLPDAEETFTQAAALCWRWADIRAANHAHRSLTAVLYERPDQHARGLADTEKLLRNENIDFARIADLPAKVRRLELQGHLF